MYELLDCEVCRNILMTSNNMKQHTPKHILIIIYVYMMTMIDKKTKQYLVNFQGLSMDVFCAHCPDPVLSRGYACSKCSNLITCSKPCYEKAMRIHKKECPGLINTYNIHIYYYFRH